MPPQMELDLGSGLRRPLYSTAKMRCVFFKVGSPAYPRKCSAAHQASRRPTA
jgi:hypothetical protein